MPEVSSEPGRPLPGQPPGHPVPSNEFYVVKVAAAVKVAATLVSAAVIIVGLYYGRDVLIPLALALLITFALHPAVTWLVRRGLPRLLATSLAMALVVCTLAGLGIILGAQVRSIAVELPAYQSTMQKKLADLRDSLKAPGLFDGVLKTVASLQKEVESKERKPADGPVPQRAAIETSCRRSTTHRYGLG